VKKQIVLAFLVFLFFRLPAGALDIQGPSSIGDYFDGIYGEDTNADQGAFPLLTLPIGGRARGLASAFTAVADDASFLDFNPAGSARLERSELAFFHSNWFDGNLAGTLVEGLVFTQRIGNLGIAAGGKWLSTPIVEYDQAGTRLSTGYYSEIAAALNGAYNFSLGPRFSGISVGASLKGAFRQLPDDEYSTSAVVADLGALSSFNLFKFYQSPDWNASVGLALKNLGPAGREALPSQAALGLAYKPLESLLFSFDLFLPFNMRDITHSGKPYFAAGLEFAYGAFPSLRGGVQLKTGSLRVAAGSSLHLFGDPRSPGTAGKAGQGGIFLDLDYSRELRSPDQPQNRLSLGIRLGLGRGTRTGGQAENLYTEGLEAYARGDYQEARRCWEEALTLDGRFLPAREALTMLEETQAAGKRVDEFLEMEL
jgi:tetratricopeptide (TPR) repeat protein